MDFDLEAELAGIVDNDVNQSENYQLFYKLDRRCRDLEKENVSLKQQLLKDRETFEKEKEQLLLKQSELYAISAQFDVFKAQIKDLFGVECATADDLARAVSQTDRHTRTDSSRKALAMKDQRIEKLEAELREIKSLYEKTESDNDLPSSRRRLASSSRESKHYGLCCLRIWNLPEPRLWKPRLMRSAV